MEVRKSIIKVRKCIIKLRRSVIKLRENIMEVRRYIIKLRRSIIKVRICIIKLRRSVIKIRKSRSIESRGYYDIGIVRVYSKNCFIYTFFFFKYPSHFNNLSPEISIPEFTFVNEDVKILQ